MKVELAQLKDEAFFQVIFFCGFGVAMAATLFLGAYFSYFLSNIKIQSSMVSALARFFLFLYGCFGIGFIVCSMIIMRSLYGRDFPSTSVMTWVVCFGIIALTYASYRSKRKL
jgi:hypothetical protein